MPRVLDPIQFVLIALAGWMNERQLQMIEYLREENRVLREQLGHRRLRLNDDQRRRLAVRAKGMGRKLLADIRDPLFRLTAANLQDVKMNFFGDTAVITGIYHTQGTYQGKPDTPPYSNAPFNGNRAEWDKAIATRNQNQNEYKRVR